MIIILYLQKINNEDIKCCNIVSKNIIKNQFTKHFSMNNKIITYSISNIDNTNNNIVPND